MPQGVASLPGSAVRRRWYGRCESEGVGAEPREGDATAYIVAALFDADDTSTSCPGGASPRAPFSRAANYSPREASTCCDV